MLHTLQASFWGRPFLEHLAVAVTYKIHTLYSQRVADSIKPLIFDDRIPDERLQKLQVVQAGSQIHLHSEYTHTYTSSLNIK